MPGESEYTENMRRHEIAGRGKEPKLTQVKEKVKPFEGNYTTVYNDLGQITGGQNNSNQRVCCTVSPLEKEAMIFDSVQRILDDPKMARQVFN